MKETIGRWEIREGDVRDRLAELPGSSVQCVVTSPPYWGLRDYGVAGQLGLEATPAEYIDRMVSVLREVRRVLRADGTLWLNIGDSYARHRAGHEGFGTSTLDGTRRNQKQANIASRHRRGKDCDPKRGAAAEGQPYRAVTCSRRRDDLVIPRSDIALDGIKLEDGNRDYTIVLEDWNHAMDVILPNTNEVEYQTKLALLYVDDLDFCPDGWRDLVRDKDSLRRDLGMVKDQTEYEEAA